MDYARFFLEPTNSTHRQYEALRAFFVEGLRSYEAAERFGYTAGSFRVLCHEFRQNPHRQFFLPPGKKEDTAPKPKVDPLRKKVIQLRKQNLSIYDISTLLEEEGNRLAPRTVALILQEEGFAKLPRRPAEERIHAIRPEPAPVANVRELDLSPRRFRTKFGGLFLFLGREHLLGLDVGEQGGVVEKLAGHVQVQGLHEVHLLPGNPGERGVSMVLLENACQIKHTLPKIIC